MCAVLSEGASVSTTVQLHCRTCGAVVHVSVLRMDSPDVRAANERDALEAHQCRRYEPEANEPENEGA